MNCKEFTEFSSAWAEGERRPEAQTHVNECANCQRVVMDLEAILRAGRVLGQTDLQLPPRIWNNLQAQLETEGLIRPRRWTERIMLRPSLRTALAGAYFAAVVAAAVFLSLRTPPRATQAIWLSRTDKATVGLHATLASAERSTLPIVRAQNPAVKAALDQNLAIVDNMISSCEKTVREDPQNEMARDYLYGAYEQKADLLASITESGADTK